MRLLSKLRRTPGLPLAMALTLVCGGLASAAPLEQAAPTGDVQTQARTVKPSPTPTASSWSTLGNTGTNPSANFLGTGDSADLVLRTNNVERVRVLAASGDVSMTGNLKLPATTSTAGIIWSGSQTLLHALGTNNLFVGLGAGNLATTGTSNTAAGTNALHANTSGSINTAVGEFALQSNTTGNQNTAAGEQALVNNTSGSLNTAAGQAALNQNTTGSFNTAAGYNALNSSSAGNNNTAVGANALGLSKTDDNNTAVGYRAGLGLAYGPNNTFVGANSGLDTAATGTSVANSTAIGANAQVGESNAIVLGDNSVSVGIGTTTPQSKLQVVGNYIQFPTITGTPPGSDCISDAQAGRVVVSTDGTLWICRGTAGWVGK